MKILEVRPNNRKKTFEIRVEGAELVFPYAKLDVKPTPGDRITEVYPDEDVGFEGFTYSLESGSEDTVHIDAVLEYNQDPSYLNEVLLHRLSVEAQKALDESGLSKRELIRRLATSPSQLYRLLDPTHSAKSVGQMLALLRILGRDVEVVVRSPEDPKGRGKRKVVV